MGRVFVRHPIVEEIIDPLDLEVADQVTAPAVLSVRQRAAVVICSVPAGFQSIVAGSEVRDLVFAIGAPVFTYHIEGFGPHVPPGSELFQMIDDPDVAAWTPVGTSIVCSIRLPNTTAPSCTPIPMIQ